MLRLLITAGPTQEYFDSVRFISNPSTGKMGYAIAIEAVRRGHSVDVISGPVALPAPEGVTFVPVVTAQEMLDATLSFFGKCQVAVMTAAVCDYRPAVRLASKLQKQNRTRSVELLPTEDICARLGAEKEGRVVVGFAMEDHDHKQRAEAKLHRKQCDAIVLNGLANVAADSGEIEILTRNVGWSAPSKGSKAELASVIVDFVELLTKDGDS